MTDYREEDYYDSADELYRRASHCSRFTRRGDMTVFSMGEYQSCENCRHLTAEGQCLVNMDCHFPDGML